MSTPDTADASLADALAYQHKILQDVSRTFALTIPQLPGRLEMVVGNAYLLCRIADTIEDSDALTPDEKKYFGDLFVAVLAREDAPQSFADELPPLLQGATLEAERDLIRHTEDVIRITHSFDGEELAAILRCVRIMTGGMEEFQEGSFKAGLDNLEHMDAYCYHVAGVVGEMLTELFVAWSPAIAAQKDALMKRAVSFGQGLQMTNILKDIWDDKSRDVVWLPADHFPGINLRALSTQHAGSSNYQQGLLKLVGVAVSHLENALDYTLLIPRSETGIRRFCLWAIGMAVLTLQNIAATPGFTSGNQVKISRGAVKGTILATGCCVRSNLLLRTQFKLAARGLPRAPGVRIH